METTKEKKPGRKPKKDKSKFRYMVNLNSEENEIFKMLFQESGMENISKFLNYAIFGKQIKVVKLDKATMDYYIRLTNFYNQFQAIGNNYNQTVRAVQKNFDEKRAYSLLGKLEKATLHLVFISKEIVRLTEEFELKYLSQY